MKLTRDFGRLLVLCLVLCTAAAKKDKQKSVIPKPKPRSVLATQDQLKEATFKKLEDRTRLNRREKKEVANAELKTYKDLRQKGFDEVSNTKEAHMLRQYRLRNKKKRGVLRKRESSFQESVRNSTP
jgi:hypothetical protein